ncbi:unnamed protein product, partial [Prorocentrum cordatum]
PQAELGRGQAGGDAQLLELLDCDGTSSDFFGYSVAVSSDGARVVAGAYGDDDRGAISGSANVLEGAAGERLLKLVASDGAADDKFGHSVAVSSDGARVVAVAYGDDGQGGGSGSARVFDGATGEKLLFRLLKRVASDGASAGRFGSSVAVSSDGARVVAGACGDDDQGGTSGSACVFDGATSERLLKRVASDGASADRFVSSVAVSSDGARVVAGAYYHDGQGGGSGSACVFDGATGEKLLKLVASGGGPSDSFGYSVAASSDGARVVVGACGDDDQGANSGSANVFDGATGEKLLF